MDKEAWRHGPHFLARLEITAYDLRIAARSSKDALDEAARGHVRAVSVHHVDHAFQSRRRHERERPTSKLLCPNYASMKQHMRCVRHASCAYFDAIHEFYKLFN